MTYGRKWRELRLHILKRDDHRCAYCGQPADTVDHIIPLNKGGTDHETNLTAACAKCNYGKGQTDEYTFRVKQYAKQITNVRQIRNDFFALENTQLTPPQSLSPRDFGVFEPPLFERN